MNLTKQEAATVLAALRYWQTAVIERRVFGKKDVPLFVVDHFDNNDPLGMGEIDSLCERINTDPSPIAAIEISGGIASLAKDSEVQSVIIRDYDVAATDIDTIMDEQGQRFHEYFA